ncbi:hypothetical protein NQ315_004472 [Exocentrus adspersus]|uniref:BAG domain-containing protein n=1 Tax=Exocentrus adspersus TaxID=1586481 RepID=A0AAV8VQ00_9CUCU|nr:hypothetical protein NQ315_004472 [Exocentrus adspersus]
MSSSAVETVRTIPLIIEKGNAKNHIPMGIDHTSGFPFERDASRDADRDGHLRSQLDDIAKRHPEFAEHLGNFSRRRQSSGDNATEDFHKRFERPFGAGHFERFGFPFDRDNFDPEQYTKKFYQQHPEYQHQYSEPQSYQPQPEQSQQQCSSPSGNTENSPADNGRSSNIHQSNTVDLGQKQEPVNERNQRSMSAPPADKGQRFTSSINIPVNEPSEGEDMAQTQSQQQTDGKTTERIIPIHIEGRDEPVMPKTVPPTFSQPHQQSPQPERIFGQRPEHFTQYVHPNREPKWHHPGFDTRHQGFGPEELLRQHGYPEQNVPPHYQQQRPAPQAAHVPPQPKPKGDIPIPVQVEVPLNKQQAPPQQQAAPPQPPAPPKPAPQQQKPKTPIDQIQEIQKDVLKLMGQVERFTGQPKDKQYLYLDEMLTRNLLKLDNIDTQGLESIRSARKEAIKCIEKAISVLEAKAAANVSTPKPEEKMDVEDKSVVPTNENASGENKPTEAQTMEVEPVGTTETKPENTAEPQTMEFSPQNATNEDSECESKNNKEKITDENSTVTETRAVLVTSDAPKVDNVTEPMETKEDAPAPTAEQPKESCEGQESNLPVAEAIKKIENRENEKKGDNKAEENKDSSQVEQDDKKEEKKEKKKGKKKAEKKEK